MAWDKPDLPRVSGVFPRFRGFLPYTALATPHFGGRARAYSEPSPVQRSSLLDSLAGWAGRQRATLYRGAGRGKWESFRPRAHRAAFRC